MFATFREGRGKKVYIEMEDATVSKILSALNIPIEEVAILLINGRDGEFDRILAEGDYLSIFPPVGGG